MAATRDPSPAEIELMTAEIRAGWTPEEKLRRLRPDLRPCFTLSDGRTQAMTSEAYGGHHDAHERLQGMETPGGA